MTLAQNIAFLRQFTDIHKIWAPAQSDAPPPTRLTEVTRFGANPGALRMWSYVPAACPERAPLVVVLHGCGQSAALYDNGAAWTRLADRYGFAVVMPEQTRANNRHTCFNWFDPEDVARGSGEAASIRAMIEAMVVRHRLDRGQIFVTGLSAGGAMAMAMLATYPEVFAAGAIVAGVPFGVAGNLREALRTMMRGSDLSGDDLAARVRAASRHRGPWPRLSVWQGDADRTVAPANAQAILRQWLALHELPNTPMAETVVDGQARKVWWNGDGLSVVEAFTIAGMAHGCPLGPAADDDCRGVPSRFMLDAGISSSMHIAAFFGLTERPVAIRAPAVPEAPLPRRRGMIERLLKF